MTSQADRLGGRVDAGFGHALGRQAGGLLEERRTLGATGLRLPAIGLGGAALGGMDGEVETAEAAAMLDLAWAAGVRYFDTAPLYGHGIGERRVGAALREHPRDDYVLTSKVGWRIHPLETQPEMRVQTDYSRDGTLRSVEDSLTRLGIDRLDAVFVHDVDPYNHGDGYAARFKEVLDGALPALRELRDAGLVDAIGIAVNNCAVCLDFLAETVEAGKAGFDAFLLAGRYTLLDESAASELLPACLAAQVGVIVGAPFNSGILASGAQRASRFNYQSADAATVRRVEALERHCAAHGTSLMAAALQFPLRRPAVASVLPGPRSVAQLEGVMAAAHEPVPEALWHALRDDGLIAWSAQKAPDLREDA